MVAQGLAGGVTHRRVGFHTVDNMARLQEGFAGKARARADVRHHGPERQAALLAQQVGQQARPAGAVQAIGFHPVAEAFPGIRQQV
jgi:hypothetical protein